MHVLGYLKSINFPFGINGKLMVSGVPIFKHVWVGLFVQSGQMNIGMNFLLFFLRFYFCVKARGLLNP